MILYSLIIIHQFQLSKFKSREVFMISSFQHSATFTSSLISFNYQSSKQGINKSSERNTVDLLNKLAESHIMAGTN